MIPYIIYFNVLILEPFIMSRFITYLLKDECSVGFCVQGLKNSF